MKEVIGRVTLQEKGEIKYLSGRKGGLLDLAAVVVDEDPEFYQKLQDEVKIIKFQIKKWWNMKRKKYNWPDEELYISFERAEVYKKTSG